MQNGQYTLTLNVYTSSAQPLAIAALRSTHGTHYIRVMHLASGSVFWDEPGCAFGFIKKNDSHDGRDIIAVSQCDEHERRSNFALHNATTGAHVQLDGTDIAERIQWVQQGYASATVISNANGVWKEFASIAGVKGANGTVPVDVISKAQGELVVKPKVGRGSVWSRHEGVAHSIAAAFYSSSYDTRDAQGILVTLTEFGTLFGFDLEAPGNVLWHTDVKFDGSTVRAENCTLLTGHVSNAVVVCVPNDHTDVQTTSLYVVDAATGTTVLEQTLNGFVAAHGSVLRECCSPEHACVHLVDSNGNVRRMTSCDESYIEAGEWTRNSPTYMSAREGAGHVEGLRDGRVAWRLQLPQGMVVAKLALEPQPHAITLPLRKAAVRVTGDRRLFYKAIDPALSMILAEDEATTKLAAILIDGESGSVIAARNHVNASRPFSAVRSDNWFVYTFWNTYLLQQELRTIDMYEPQKESHFLQDTAKNFIAQVLRPTFGTLNIDMPILLETSHNDGVCPAQESSGDDTRQCAANPERKQIRSPPRVEIVSQSYVLSHRVEALDVSETEGSITERSLVFALSSGQVASLSRLAVDARRPMQQSAVDPTEALAMYSPYISFQPSETSALYVTRDQYLTNLVGLAVAPVPRQESSCHVAAFGTDLFYSKFAPAGSFDTLPSDFRFSVVIGTVLLLLLSVYYGERLREEKELTAAW